MIALAELAHKYEVKGLLADCERCLRHAHDVSALKRLLLADRLQLKGARNYIFGLRSMSLGRTGRAF